MLKWVITILSENEVKKKVYGPLSRRNIERKIRCVEKFSSKSYFKIGVKPIGWLSDSKTQS